MIKMITGRVLLAFTFLIGWAFSALPNTASPPDSYVNWKSSDAFAGKALGVTHLDIQFRMHTVADQNMLVAVCAPRDENDLMPSADPLPFAVPDAGCSRITYRDPVSAGSSDQRPRAIPIALTSFQDQGVESS